MANWLANLAPSRQVAGVDPLSDVKAIGMILFTLDWLHHQGPHDGDIKYLAAEPAFVAAKLREEREKEEAREEARQWMHKVAGKIYFGENAGLPNEIVDHVLDAMAVAQNCNLPPLETMKGLREATAAMLIPLARCVWSRYGKIETNAFDKSDVFFKLFEQCVAREHVLPNSILRVCNPIFPKNAQSTNLPYPADFKDSINRILHLEVVINIGSSGGGDVYPVQLFRLQDHIADLAFFFPKLKSICVTIDHPQQRRMRARLPAGLSGAATTMDEELKKLIAEYQKLEVGMKYLWYDRCSKWRSATARSFREPIRAENDVREMELDEVVSQVLHQRVLRM
ncbi:hypothetical protein LTR36_004826 [Oleoguttula mirabilis]|uniref:Uncharacterized protein n=1 Tax=Oleoguttula mirabilis TaxID=1507867 RepID=A0AAV9JFV4_9PEZI|nr:hypothetical protein LTR36_004826 [Oleoguttula mirabilis]